MALSNHERVGKALDLLSAGLRPFVERELQAAHGKDWVARSGLLDPRAPAGKKPKEPRLDAHALLGVMWDQWNDVFRKTLGQAERSLVSELREGYATSGPTRKPSRRTMHIEHSTASSGC